MQEEFLTNSEGLAVTDSTWTYKIPTIDTVPKQINIELLSSGYHQKRVLSSKGMSFKLFYCFPQVMKFLWNARIMIKEPVVIAQRNF